MAEAPDYIAQCGEPMSGEERQKWISARVAEASQKGCQACRLTMHPEIPSLILFEAWANRHAKQGDPEWQLQERPNG